MNALLVWGIKLEVWSRDRDHAHFRDCPEKYFLRDMNGKLCSKFGEDRSKTELTILAVVAGWMDGRTDTRWTLDGHAKVNLYSVQCYTLHWTDNNPTYMATVPQRHRQTNDLQ